MSETRKWLKTEDCDNKVKGPGSRPEYILPVRRKWKVLQRSGNIVE